MLGYDVVIHMSVEKIENTFTSLMSKHIAMWQADAEWRSTNKEWLKNSQAIAIKLNAELRKKNISNKRLAELIGVTSEQVSKIVKGRENLTLETISKIECALGLSFFLVPQDAKIL